VSCYQSIRIQTLADIPGGPGGGSEIGIASFNSIAGNSASWDISYATRGSSSPNNIAVYQANNMSANGVAAYNDGSYTFLASDPNAPH